MTSNFYIKDISDFIGREAASTKNDAALFKSILSTEIIKSEDGDSDDRKKTFCMSAEVRDRHGDMVVLKGGDLSHYNANPGVYSMHETFKDYFEAQPYDWDNLLGYGHAYLKNGKLYNDITFEPADLNPKADKIYRKIEFGSVRACSIGFIPYKGHWGVESDGEDTGTYYITDWQLMELSIVTIGANPLALLESDQKNLEKPKETKIIKNIGATSFRLRHYHY